MTLTTPDNDWEKPGNTPESPDDKTALLGWLMPKIKIWRQYRDDNYKPKWDEYYRIWRGVWDAQDKLRESERSRLISPATQQAVEGAVAEMEEATFGRDVWFDLDDDPKDKASGQNKDIEAYRTQLKYDLEKEKVKKRVCEAMLNGALFGTGIGEIIVERKSEFSPTEKQIPNTTLRARGTVQKEYIAVWLNPVSPYNFSIDPGTSSVDDALGCEVTEIVPEYQVIDGISSGVYDDVDYGSYTDDGKTFHLSGETRQIPSEGHVKLTRYYGRVPIRFLSAEKEKTDSSEYEDLAEALVVIANDQAILKAARNPYMMQDRPVVAYQHDTVPGRFHGRGVCEKGYNPQKALDTELRARADNLALTTHPMMGVDASRLPRGMKPKVMPGNTILTNGDPSTILHPLTFGSLNPVSFKESAELERMVTMGTGTMDTAAPLGVNPRNATLGGMSLMQAASIKRQKRTLSNFQDGFLIPFIKKAAYRFMQFDPERYPVTDIDFKASSSMGIMARELEIQNMVTLLGYVGESPASLPIVKAIIDHSSFADREDLNAQIDAAAKTQANAQNQTPPDLAMKQQSLQLDAAKMKQEALDRSEERKLKAMQIKIDQERVAVDRLRTILEATLKEHDINARRETDAAKLVVQAHGEHADRSVEAVTAAAETIRSEIKAEGNVSGAIKKGADAIEKMGEALKPQSKVFTMTTPSGKTVRGEIRPNG